MSNRINQMKVAAAIVTITLLVALLVLYTKQLVKEEKSIDHLGIGSKVSYLGECNCEVTYKGLFYIGLNCVDKEGRITQVHDILESQIKKCK